jgi:electron transport complex protein RnfG
MAAESNLKNMALCLTLVCLFCSAVLAAVYVVTKDPIERANANILKESIGLVLPPGGDLSEERPLEVGGLPSVYYVSSSAGTPAAYAIQSSTVGFSGPLTLMVGITADGKIYNTSVLSHSETPGLGAKCATDEPFMMQFEGFDPAEKILAVKKDGGDLDAITASTITSRAYALAIQNALAAFQTIKGE